MSLKSRTARELAVDLNCYQLSRINWNCNRLKCNQLEVQSSGNAISSKCNQLQMQLAHNCYHLTTHWPLHYPLPISPIPVCLHVIVHHYQPMLFVCSNPPSGQTVRCHFSMDALRFSTPQHLCKYQCMYIHISILINQDKSTCYHCNSECSHSSLQVWTQCQPPWKTYCYLLMLIATYCHQLSRALHRQ